MLCTTSACTDQGTNPVVVQDLAGIGRLPAIRAVHVERRIELLSRLVDQHFIGVRDIDVAIFSKSCVSRLSIEVADL